MLLVTGPPIWLDWLPLNFEPCRYEYALDLIMWEPDDATNFGKVAAAVANFPPTLDPAAPPRAPFWLIVLPAFLEDDGN